MSYLFVLEGPQQGQRFRLAEMTIGGGLHDAIQVAGIPDGAARLAYDGHDWRLTSSVPFQVNEASSTDSVFRPGEVLTIGGLRLQFRSEDTVTLERRSVSHLDALYRVSSVLTGTGDVHAALTKALEILMAETSAVRGAVYQAEDDGGRIDRVAEKSWKEAQGPFPAGAASIRDLEVLVSALHRGGAGPISVFPLVASAHPLGAFVLQPPGPGELHDREAELVTAISLIAGIALENRRNARQMEESGRLLMSIEKATMWLSSYLEREPILGEAVGFARSIFRASHVSIVEIFEGGDTARVVRTATTRRGDGTQHLVKVGVGWCGKVLQSGKPLLSPDPETGKPPEGFERAKRFKTDSFAIVPIYSSVSDGAQILGSINVADKIGGRPFNKSDLEMLSVLARAVGVALHNAQLYERATVDSLTRVFVRQHFFYVLEEMFSRAQKLRRPLSLVVLDLDDFKKVNDTHGHPAGDAVLREVGAAIKRSLRVGDVAARYGGEEFAVLFPGSTLAEGSAVCEKILESIRGCEIPAGTGMKIKMTASLGLAELRSGDTPESLIARADAAQYRAKYGGKNRLVLADK